MQPIPWHLKDPPLLPRLPTQPALLKRTNTRTLYFVILAKYLGTYLASTSDGYETHHLYVLYYVTYFYLLSMINLFIKYLYRMEHRPYLPVNTYIRYLPYVNKRNGSSHTYNHCVIARMQLSHTYVPYLRIGARLRPIEKWKHISGYPPG